MITRLVLLAAAGAALTSCGRLGDLQQPPPLFGDAARAAYTAEQADGRTPDETSAAENEREDDQTALPTPNEEVGPRNRGEFGTPAAPVNIPPAPVAPPPVPSPVTTPSATPVTPTTPPG